MSDRLDSLVAGEAIESAYKRYLQTLITPREPALAEALVKAVEDTKALTHGPLLELTPPHATGASIGDLIAEGVLNSGFRKIDMPVDRPLYRHQEEAIRKATRGRNLVVTTGTGSGKTESFLIPILNSLTAEYEAGSLGPGVRALLLYPMNALANDQVKRLRGLLHSAPHITFGRYTGETKESKAEAEKLFNAMNPGEHLLPNHLHSREEMRANPPHILLANYAMLEYLLLRPRDLDLFEGRHGGHWRFVVVDEAHVYDGAQGSEVGLLLRRLRDRVAPKTTLQWIATSASLDGEPKEVMKFASDLFDGPFEWIAGDEVRQDLVVATRVQRKEPPTWGPLGAQDLLALSKEPSAERLRELSGIDDPAEALHREHTTAQLTSLLAPGPRTASELAETLWPGTPDSLSRLQALVALGSRVIDSSGNPVLSARYHMFVRATEGAYTCLSAQGPHVQLGRHETCPECAAACFEFGTCSRCGAVHLAGEFRDENRRRYFKPTRKLDSQAVWLVLSDHDEVVDDDEATLDVSGKANKTGLVWLCTTCGMLHKSPVERCVNSECASETIRGVRQHDQRRRVMESCTECGARAIQLIRRLHLGADAPPAVLTTALYQQLPEAEDKSVENVGGGRKLLMFSDSRQAAAFAAPYLSTTYGRLLERRCISEAISGVYDEGLTVNDLVNLTERAASNYGVFDKSVSLLSRRDEVASWVMSELIALDHRQSLEGLGLLKVGFRRPEGISPKPLMALGLSEEEAWAFVEELARTARQQGVLTMPSNVPPNHPRFEPRLGPIWMRSNGSEAKKKILSWLPTRGTNTRIDFVQRVLDSLRAHANAKDILDGCWRFLQHIGWLKEQSDRFAGVTSQIDHTALVMRSGLTLDWRQCDVCRRITSSSVRNVCPGLRCDGKLERFEVPDIDSEKNHYRYSYRTMIPVPLSAMEHTAQWTSTEAAEVQTKFIKGEVNVLSCSTTFELGVDVGDLQSVMLRNMPPKTANYVQRAGRAGRRASSAALVVTYAQRRSHDLSRFQNPIAMIKGKMRVPWVPVDNERIGRRHAHSIALAAFFRDYASSHGDADLRRAGKFFLPGTHGDAPAMHVRDFLTPVPPDIQESLRRALPKFVQDEIDLDGGSWVAVLSDLIDRVAVEMRADNAHFESLIQENAKQRKYRVAEALDRTLKTINDRELLGFLANRNILPKYGFPVDTVELRTLHAQDAIGRKLELSRDLSQAIYDYAPGNQVVAGGRLWTSRGIYRLPGKELDSHKFRICRDCGRFESSRDLEDGVCDVCGGQPRVQGRMVVPEFGFVSDTKTAEPGSAPPIRRWNGTTHIQDEGDQIDQFVWTAPSGQTVGARAGTRATLVAVSEGTGRGYWICSWCGYAAPRDHLAKSGDHQRPINGESCAGQLFSYFLAHRYQTDVARFTLSGYTPLRENEWWSTLYAIIEGASERLEISRDDIDGSLSWTENGQRSLVVFDTVPGGAGAAKRIAEHIGVVLEAARDRVASCDCGPETSCYGCLRSYRNARIHEILSRGDALKILDALDVRSEVPDAWRPQIDNALTREAQDFLRALSSSVQAPVPEVGAEVGDHFWPVEALWAEAQVVLVDDEDTDRDRWLKDAGFVTLRLGDTTVDQASAVLAGG